MRGRARQDETRFKTRKKTKRNKAKQIKGVT